MTPYPKYKPSGIDWIGEIPDHWELKKIKHKAKTLAGGTPATGNPDYWDGNIPWLNSGKVQNNIIDISIVDKYITDLGLKESATKMIKANSVLVALTGATCANIGYLTFSSTANQSVVAIENDSSLYSKHLFYYLISQREQILIEKTGGAQSGINEGDVKNLVICFPPPTEQITIADYLDEKTAQIDDFIAKKQKLIELLKEERTAMINEAVSGKGKNWEQMKLKYVTSLITNGFVGPTRDILTQEGVRYIQSLHLKENTIKFNVPYYVSEEWSNKHKRSILKENDIVVVQTGAGTGNISIIPKDFENCNCHALIIIRIDKTKSDPYFIMNLLTSNSGNYLLKNIETGALHPHLNSTKICDIEISVPTIIEQIHIVAHINTETQRIDNTISKIEKEIELMREYRMALISEVVTGKIDVRKTL